MSLFLDSALASDARTAMSLGFVAGITTNPNLLAQIQRDPAEVIVELADICSGSVFYQLTAPTLSTREAEARRMLALLLEMGDHPLSDQAVEEFAKAVR